MHIRIADPERDAEAVAAIYRQAVEDSIASFEEVVPTTGEMGERMGSTLRWTPWLVVGFACRPVRCLAPLCLVRHAPD